jgi:DNA-binding Xre family transcriptional regulator
MATRINRMVSAPIATSASSQRRGRPAGKPATALRLWVEARLAIQKRKSSDLARALHVSAGTITRFLNGDSQVVRAFTSDAICRALELNAMNRRTFLRIVAEAGVTFATASPALRYDGLDIESELDLAEALNKLVDVGDPHFVKEKAEHHYAKLMARYADTSDERIARAQIRFGLLLGISQERVLPWFQRSKKAIITYSHVEDAIIARFPANAFLTEYAEVFERRAPLLRGLGQHEKSDFQYTLGLDLARAGRDALREATLLRNEAHMYAITGDEKTWEKLLQQSADIIGRLPQSEREMFTQLVLYSRAEGYKRLAFTSAANLGKAMRERYALAGYDAFEESQERLQTHTLAHHLLSRISQAQCLVWLDPRAAIALATSVEAPIRQSYPALLAKMQRVLDFAYERLSRCYKDPLPIFDLDARGQQKAVLG